MNTLDDLRSSLDAYADRGAERGPGAVWAAATAGDLPTTAEAEHPRRPTPRLAVAVAAVVALLVGTVVLVRSRSDETGVVTAPTPDTVAPAPRALAPIAVPDGIVRVVHVASDRVWVGTGADGAAASRVRSFDVTTRELVTDTEVHGWPIALVTTDGAVWVQTDAYAGDGGAGGDGDGAGDGGASGPADTTLYRIDPTTGAVVTEIPQVGAGPMAAAGSRLAVADRATLTVVDDELGTVASTSIADAVGHPTPGAADPAAASFILAALQYGPDGLVGLAVAVPIGATDSAPNELVTIDPETGRHRSTIVLDVTSGALPFVAQAGGVTWLGWDRELVAVADSTSAPLRIEGGSSDLPVIEIEPFDERVVALTSTDVFVVARDTTTLVTPLDPAANGAAIVQLDGHVWAARWSDADGDPETIVSFVYVHTDPGGPPASFQVPTTDPAPPSTVVGDGVPTILVMADDPLVDGETYGLLGAGLPPGRAILLLCLQDDPSGTKDCRTAFDPSPQQVVAVADDGSLILPWVALRSLYDSRWHDCATERCVLRLYGYNDAGGRDLTDVIAETPPLSFSADAPPVRPTIRVVDESPLTVGMTGTIIGEHFPANAKGITVGLCRTGDRAETCRYAVHFNQMADENGRVEIPFTIPSGTITMPSLDPAAAEVIDCTTAPGTCSFAIFPNESSVEPFATVPVEIAG